MGQRGLLTQVVWGKRSNEPQSLGPSLPTALGPPFGGCTRVSSPETKGCLRSGFAPCDLLG